jgi:DNA polymerase-3 subunit gamma/tau
LSRCQVYDFTRITVADTIHHLQYVAKSEGITVNEEALNVVAQKADGGMRDALSIFDQLVAFCGKTISYEQTIEVLNVLSSEYYFRLVDCALKGAVSDALLLLNEVLQKGFDAGNFITGFAQHLRDVLVSKDAATAQLLETSEAIRQHYQQQATTCPARWLFNALDIVNTCDINYRTARNKRLTVELALVKLCRLVEGSGVQEVRVAEGSGTTRPTAPAPAPQAKVAPASQAKPAAKPAPQAIPQMGAMPSIGSLGTISINTTSTAKPTTTAAPAESTKETRNTPFTEDQLSDAWVGLAEHFPGEERLKAMLSSVIPELINPELCRIVVANPWQKEEFAKFGKKVMDIVRNKLKNDLLKLQVEVDTSQHSRRAYTSAEKYRVLEQMNPHIAELRSVMKLQLE